MRKALAAAISIVVLSAGAAFAQTPDIVAALDANQDGMIQRAEFSAMVEANFARQDADGDGRLTGDERSNHHGQPGPEQNQEEFTTLALTVFDGEDTDSDGVIAGDELDRFRAHIAEGGQPRH